MSLGYRAQQMQSLEQQETTWPEGRVHREEAEGQGAQVLVWQQTPLEPERGLQGFWRPCVCCFWGLSPFRGVLSAAPTDVCVCVVFCMFGHLMSPASVPPYSTCM